MQLEPQALEMPESQRVSIATTRDPEGRRVGLTFERWTHIKDEHARLAPKMREILAAVREPYLSVRGRSEHEMWFIAEDAGRFPWLKVVVHYEGGEGWIVTAFPTNALPSR